MKIKRLKKKKKKHKYALWSQSLRDKCEQNDGCSGSRGLEGKNPT